MRRSSSALWLCVGLQIVALQLAAARPTLCMAYDGHAAVEPFHGVSCARDRIRHHGTTGWPLSDLASHDCRDISLDFAIAPTKSRAGRDLVGHAFASLPARAPTDAQSVSMERSRHVMRADDLPTIRSVVLLI